MATSSDTLHATCVAIHGHGVLILGQSSAGKSDLALRLIDRGAELVSDDYTIVRRDVGALVASPPSRIAGMIEVRGIGLVTMPHLPACPVRLCVDLDGKAERMPDDHHITVAGLSLPVIALSAHEPSAPIKVELALKQHRSND